MSGLGQDLRFALRQIRRNPGFALAAALTLALGIAATTTVFSFVDAALLRPLPYPEPERLFMVWTERGDKREEPASYLNFLDWRARSTHFEHLAVYRQRRVNVTAGNQPERVQGAYVSAEFLRTLGIDPTRGRDFTAGEDLPGHDRVALVSDRFWRRRLGGDHEALGRSIRIDGVPLTVVGVVPARLGFPAEAEVWMPVSLDAEWLLESRGLQGYRVVGRLRHAVAPAAAQGQLATIAAGLAQEYPQHNEGWTIRLAPLREAMVAGSRPTLLLLFGSALVLLSVAAVNLANMLLARGAARQREISVRRAIGAGQGRLMRQLLTESLVLAAMGGMVGVAGAVWGVHAWRSAWESTSGLPMQVAVEWRVLLFATAVTGATALLFGLAPALRITRGRLTDMLRQGGTSTARLRRSGRVLVAGEVGLALMLGFGGTLLVRSLLQLQSEHPGFDPGGVLTARVSLPEATYAEPGSVVSFYRELLREIEALPGVRAAGAADAVPLMQTSGTYGFAIEGRPVPPVQEWPVVDLTSTTPDFFRALAIPTVRGRVFRDGDTEESPRVAVINEAMARRFWPGRDPLGARLSFDASRKHWVEVVGVVGDVRKQALGRPPEPQVFLAHAQSGDPALTLVVRADVDPLQLIGPIQAILHRLDPEIPLSEARTMKQVIGASIVPQRLRTLIFGVFAGLTLLLAGIGIYGVMAYLVTQREREIAVRVALGAGRPEVIGGVIGHSLRLAGPGIALGLLGALLSARVMRSFLYEVEPTDPLSLALVGSAVAALVIAAALAPARRAAGADPMAVLRSD